MFIVCLWQLILLMWDIHAAFILACRNATWSLLAVSWVQFLAAMPLWLITEWRSAAVGKAARLSIYWQDAAWSSLCGKWCLRSFTNIIIKAASSKLVWKQHWEGYHRSVIFKWISLLCNAIWNPHTPLWKNIVIHVHTYTHTYHIRYPFIIWSELKWAALVKLNSIRLSPFQVRPIFNLIYLSWTTSPQFNAAFSS